jgi:hypothetical protein
MEVVYFIQLPAQLFPILRRQNEARSQRNIGVMAVPNQKPVAEK